MNVPENDAKRVPHALKELPASAVQGKGWRVVLMLSEQQGGPIECLAGDSVAEATQNAQDYLDKHMPGRTL